MPRHLSDIRNRRYKLYDSPRKPGASIKLKKDDIPHVTVIRPAKGLEPQLYECLACAFRQDYPVDKVTIYICVASQDDPAYQIAKKVVDDFPDHDAKVLVEEEDPLLHGQGGHVDNLGPNPKIRNISRAYREAKGDLIWILDCNVWVAKGVLGRMVDRLCGYQHNGKLAQPFKFVHHLPLVVDITDQEARATSAPEREQLLPSPSSGTHPIDSANDGGPFSTLGRAFANGGGRLDEMFFATTHAKFYAAINTVSVAPCIIGKSNMFRRSHLDACTDPALNPILSSSDASRPRGIDFFSSYICEDHLIGDLLWRSSSCLPGYAAGYRFRNHGLVYGDVCIQPMAGVSVGAYFARRARWLRVRKWTVLLATLVEPGVESLLCSFYFSFAVTTALGALLRHRSDGTPWASSWTAMFVIWLATVLAWAVLDWFVSHRLHEGRAIEADADSPRFARGTGRCGGMPRRTLREWIPAWIGREVLALPIWIWAVLLGTTVTWRGKRFRVHTNMRVVEIEARGTTGKRRSGLAAESRRTPETENGRARSKDRVD